jgi:hypothetical protein
MGSRMQTGTEKCGWEGKEKKDKRNVQGYRAGTRTFMAWIVRLGNMHFEKQSLN